MGKPTFFTFANIRSDFVTLFERFQRPIGRKMGRFHAFTLVELLVVLVIIGILTAATTLGLPAILNAKNVGGSADSIAGYLNSARAQAMGQNAYVVTGFNTSNPSNLQLIGFRSLDGTWSVTGNGTGVAFEPISKPQNFPNIQLLTGSSLPANMQSEMSAAGLTSSSYLDGFLNSPTSVTSGLPMTAGTSSSPFNESVLIFTPQGQVLVPANKTFPTTLSGVAYERSILIGLIGSHGGVITNNAATQSAAILVDGDSGKTTVYRP